MFDTLNEMAMKPFKKTGGNLQDSPADKKRIELYNRLIVERASLLNKIKDTIAANGVIELYLKGSMLQKDAVANADAEKELLAEKIAEYNKLRLNYFEFCLANVGNFVSTADWKHTAENIVNGQTLVNEEYRRVIFR